MLLKDKIYSLIFLCVVSFSGCTTLEDAKMAKGNGQYRIYAATFDSVWQEAHKLISEFGLQFVDENLKEGYILAKRNVTLMSYGESIAIYISSVEDGKTRIEIISLKKMQTNLFAPNWANKFFKVLDGVFTSTPKV